MTKRGPIPILVGIGLCLVLGLVLVYWFWIRPVPSYPRVQRSLPKPNARDDFMAAGKMAAATGGSKILGRDGKPVRRNGAELYASGPGVTAPELRVVVARNRAALARLRQGFGKQFGTPPVPDMLAEYPELPQYRDLARLLVAEGKLAEHEGRMRDAARSYMDCLRLGTMAPRGGPLIHGLVGIAVHAIALRALEDAISRFDAVTAVAAIQEMDRLERAEAPLADHLIEEREVITAGMQEFIRDPGSMIQRTDRSERETREDGERRAALELGMRVMPKKWLVDNMRGYMEHLIAASRQPYYARPSAPPLPRDPLSHILLPVFDKIPHQWARHDATWRIMKTRLALQAYQRRHHSLPPNLAALAPAYLRTIPQDPYAPKPLIYRLNSSAPLVYSRGPDGDDDGGRDLGTGAEPTSDGDLVTTRRVKKR